MDFSESYRSSLPPVFSPDGTHVAVAVEYRLVIRDVESLQVAQIYSCADRIGRVEWSPDSRYILCTLPDRAAVQVWSLQDPEWACKIDEGPAGVTHCRWSPDGLSVLIVADFCVRMTVWSLVDRRCTYLPGPKHATKGLAFDPSGSCMAVLERKDCKDWVALYDYSAEEGWGLRSRFALDTMDAADLSWSPDGSKIAIWDSPLAFRVVIHAADDGARLGEFDQAREGLGVKAAAWAPGGDALAVGGYDEVTRVLNPLTWRPVVECQHGSPVDAPRGVAVYREVEDARGPLALVQLKAMDQLGRQHGETFAHGTLAWSPDSQLLATINENMPDAVWIWDLRTTELAAVLTHIAPVKAIAWSPAGQTLAAVTGGGRLYLWSPAGASVVHVPLPGFAAVGAVWATGGGALALYGKDTFCCGYVAAEPSR